MAEEDSKFLKFQDKDGNLLIDSCPDVEFVPAPLDCPDCKPDPKYIAPNWKSQTIDEPWLNQKECRYYITVTTPETSLLPEGATVVSDTEAEEHLKTIYTKYVTDAALGLLVAYNKKTDDSTIDLIIPAMKAEKSSLDSRKFSRLKLLYSIAYEDFAGLEEQEGDADGEDDSNANGVTVVYDANEIYHKLRTFQKTMKLYAGFYYGRRLIDKGSLIFQHPDGVETLYTNEQLDRYGTGVFGEDYMMSALTSLDDFLNNRGFNIFTGFEIADWFSNKNIVGRVELFYNNEYFLEKLKVTAGCGEAEWTGRKLQALTRKEIYKDPTAMAYFAQLNEMDRAIKSRETPAWIEFLTTYTYPPVKETFDWPYADAGPSEGGCIVGALEREAKQLGVDILNDTMSIGKAAAYAYVKNVCMSSSAEDRIGAPVEQMRELGLLYTPTESASGEMAKKNILAYSTEQAFKELESSSQPFINICAKMGTVVPGTDKKMLDDMWSGAFDQAKLAGLKSFLLEGVTCLMGSVTFEEFLATSLQSALESMTLENFGELFGGLPPERQQAIQDKLNARWESGELLEENSNSQYLSDVIQDMPNGVPSPWLDPSMVALHNAHVTEDPATNAPIVPTTISGNALEPNRRTLATRLDTASQTYSSVPGIMELWASQMIQEYQEDLLELLEPIGKFPGAQVITHTLLELDCPLPPLMTPTFMAKMSSLRPDLPQFKTKDDVKIPKTEYPAGWVPKYKDWTAFIYEAAKLVIQQVLIQTITRLIKKVCQLLGDAICAAIETAGKLAAAAITDGSSAEFGNIIRDSICGPDADQATVDKTIQEMFEKLGVGGAALADPIAVQNFVSDVSSAASRKELLNAFDGEMSAELAEIIDNLIEYEYPQFRQGLSNRGAIAGFFKNIGNIMPIDVRAAMKDFVNSLPEQDILPANPSLCATPEDLEDYCNLRAALLTGRSTPAQSQEMCQADKDERLADLADLANALNGLPVDLPPMLSDPGCENGLFPFENPAQTAATATALGGSLEQLKIDFTKDMIGNGPFWSDWGFLNMTLSDTMGKALSTHHREVSFSRSKVDFVSDLSLPDDYVKEENFLWVFSDPVATDGQYSNFPKSVAEWLRDQIDVLPISYNLNNDFSGSEIFDQSFEALGVTTWNGSVNVLGVPDYGYNINLTTQWDSTTNASTENGASSAGFIRLERLPRKSTPDLHLEFRDNFDGQADWDPAKEGQFGVGYNIGLYLSDIVQKADGTYTNKGLPTAPLDANRVLIYEMLNEAAMAMENREAGSETLIQDMLFEFLAVDDTLGYFYEDDGTRLSEFPNFTSCFETHQDHTPPVVLLNELLDKVSSFEAPTKGQLRAFIQDYMSQFTNDIKAEIAGNKAAWAYGAKFDDLSQKDIEYVVDDNQVTDAYVDGVYYDLVPGGTLYGSIKKVDTTATKNFNPDGLRSLRNSDAIMGLSRDQYENKNAPKKIRAYYLNPSTYGGTYTSPPIYIKPQKNEGWMGMAEVLFPETSPCKPSKKEMVDFDGIQEEVNDNYNKVAEDPRLANENECTLQVPYNRILERPSVAGIEGVIRAACRIYVTTHFLKASALFSVFNPTHHRETFGSLYAQFIVEDMEKSFKDAQNGFFEFFNPFKDEEFWYGFLEMAVQTYSRYIDEERIVSPKPEIRAALTRLNDMQEQYQYPSRADLQDAKESGSTKWWQTLDSYREEKNFETVQATEEDAKLILKEFVMMELEEMGATFTDNLKTLDRQPKYERLGYYVLTNKSQGGIDLDLHKTIEKELTELPKSGEGYYTAGNEFSDSMTAEMYTGYYHVQQDDDGTPVYVAGEYQKDGEDQAVLRPWSNKIVVPIGDIQEYDSGANYVLTSTETPFIVEKYISINGNKKNPTAAIDTIRSKSSGNISDHYPGTMQLLTETDEVTGEEKEIGITGELGVRHGLLFSIGINGQKYEITSVEIDALDLKVTDVQPLEGNSELLFCLIRHLVDDSMFRMLTQYIFPMPKALSTMAIYNDLGFLPSIAQVTVEEGLGKPGWWGPTNSDRTIETIPGMIATFPDAQEGDYTPNYDNSREGWANYEDRQPGFLAGVPGSPQWIFGLFVVTWDEWDRVLLKNSKARLKQMFRSYYYSKDFSPFHFKLDFGKIFLKNLKGSMFPSPAIKLLPWWKRNKIRANPFDANGNLCDKN